MFFKCKPEVQVLFNFIVAILGPDLYLLLTERMQSGIYS